LSTLREWRGKSRCLTPILFRLRKRSQYKISKIKLPITTIAVTPATESANASLA